MKISIVVPVYKCKDCMFELYKRALSAIQKIPDFTSYELILVEDCGNDGAWPIIEDLCKRDLNVIGIQLGRNFGQHHAITAGMDYVTGDYAVVMDCDLQDSPEYIVEMYLLSKQGFDVVCARRAERKDGAFKKITSKLWHAAFQWLSGLNYDSRVANYRIINKKVIDAYRTMRESTRSFGGQIHWLGFNTGYLDVPHESRFYGKSAYTFRRLINLAIDTIISYSNKPLKISISIGFSIFFISVLLSAYVLMRKLIWDIPVDGWTSLILSIWIFGGAIIMNLGMVGLYIGKIYDESKGRPLYTVGKQINVKKFIG